MILSQKFYKSGWESDLCGPAFLCMGVGRKGQETGLAVWVCSYKSFMQDAFSTRSTEAPWLNLLIPAPAFALPEPFPVFGNTLDTFLEKEMATHSSILA